VRDVRNSLMRKLFSNSGIINFGLKGCILVMYYACKWNPRQSNVSGANFQN
jgi:hypothetical protein